MTLRQAHNKLRKLALNYPEAYEESPWGERVVKVRNKIFVFLSLYKGNLSVTTKLPNTGLMALSLEFTKPTGYGLGKSGWVSAVFTPDDDDVPVELLAEWIDESYRTIAPKKLIKTLDGEGSNTSTSTKAKKKKAKTKKRAKKKKGKQPAVLLVGEDPLRLERCEKALKAEGLTKVTTTTHKGLGRIKRSLDLVVFDLSRKAVGSLELAAEYAEDAKQGTRVVLCGVRDARFERRAKKALPKAAGYLRGAPGNPDAIAKLVTLADKGSKR